jgi:dTMP kinase
VSAGIFVVVEGIDGCGKSTQARLLAERLRAQGREVVLTREPGGTDPGQVIRSVVLAAATETLDPRTEALLIAADRAEHAARVIRPALERGADVVSDRYVPSSLAYQGVGRGLGVDVIAHLSHWATGGLVPDVVVVVDVDDATAAARRGAPRDRLEAAGEAFAAAVAGAYRDLARTQGWTVVDGSGAPEVVAEAVWEVVRSKL